jgi:hypothetical protein
MEERSTLTILNVMHNCLLYLWHICVYVHDVGKWQFLQQMSQRCCLSSEDTTLSIQFTVVNSIIPFKICICVNVHSTILVTYLRDVTQKQLKF